MRNKGLSEGEKTILALLFWVPTTIVIYVRAWPRYKSYDCDGDNLITALFVDEDNYCRSHSLLLLALSMLVAIILIAVTGLILESISTWWEARTKKGKRR